MGVEYARRSVYTWYNQVVREEGHPYSEIHQPHDKSYKFLLSSTDNFLELLQSFVHEEWVADIDPNMITKLDKSFILQDFRGQEADQLYRVSMKSHDVIFYVLWEFQSSVDYQMSYRLLLYMTEIWRDIVKSAGKESKRKDYRLPAIIPIVLYNGKNNWTAKLSFKETIAGQGLFEPNILDFQYLLLDVNRYSRHELINLRNFMGSALLLDQQVDMTELMSRLMDLVPVIQEWDEGKFRMFNIWLGNIIVQQLPVENRKEVIEMLREINPKEANQMISNLGNTIKEAMLKEKHEGKLEGKLEVANRMLKQGIMIEDIMRFTDLSADDLQKVMNH